MIFCILTIHIFSSCKGPEHAPMQGPVTIPKTHKALVLNEGGFGYNNADISLINIDSNIVDHDVYFRNNQVHLGDVLQSFCKYGNYYYLVLNNSGKIEITDTNFFKIRTIPNLRSPRYLKIISPTLGFVSDLFANSIQVVDPTAGTITKSIPCKGWTEHFSLDPNNKNLWVSNRYSKYIYNIDIAALKIVDSIEVTYGPCEMVFDKNQNLWVSCSGDSSNKIKSSIHCIDLNTKIILKTISPDRYFWNSQLCTNTQKDTIYWADGSIKRMPISGTSYPKESFVSMPNIRIYGISFYPTLKEIWVCDAMDYSQKGKIYRFDIKGKLIQTYGAGIIPNGVYFFD